MKVALVYDRINKWGGAERVLMALHEMFPDAPLYTSVYEKNKAPWARKFKVKTSGLQRMEFARDHNEVLALFMPNVFESFNFDEYDLVISVTSEAAKGIITKPSTKHICYCLTPTRYLWSGYDDYFRNKVMKTVSIPAVKYLRRWDLLASKRPDAYIAISSEVKGRIKDYYEQDSEVIFPPIMMNKEYQMKKKLNEDYFLLVSRFSRTNHYKRVDLAIDAFNKTGLPLKVVGDGPMLLGFKKKSNDNIEYLGRVEDEKLAEYYRNANALVFPGYEDFGLVMAEAQFFGTPVIAYKKGGALDIVKNKKTGILFKEQSVESLIRALKSFNKSDYNSRVVKTSAKRFTYDRFKEDLEKYLANKI